MTNVLRSPDASTHNPKQRCLIFADVVHPAATNEDDAYASLRFLRLRLGCRRSPSSKRLIGSVRLRGDQQRRLDVDHEFHDVLMWLAGRALEVFTVSGGQFTATVPARSAIAIHTGQLGTGSGTPGTVAVSWSEDATTTFGVPGRTYTSWGASRSWLLLSAATYPIWMVIVNLLSNTNLEYKFIRKETNGSVRLLRAFLLPTHASMVELLSLLINTTPEGCLGMGPEPERHDECLGITEYLDDVEITPHSI
ncbi:hypothetical protein B0H12DRAFT_1072981 [Mycena haematopus]|nr:hypothetical protein B0H12DRAFT_1072981 [Mycena haematopus]